MCLFIMPTQVLQALMLGQGLQLCLLVLHANPEQTHKGKDQGWL